MTDRLRALFDDMVAEEPPLRTTADRVVTHGRRRRQRSRTVWTATGAALGLSAIVLLPQVLRSAEPAGQAGAEPSVTGEVSASATQDPSQEPVPQASTSAASSTPSITRFELCPGTAVMAQSDASRLPDLARAEAAVAAKASQIAPALTFTALSYNGLSYGPKNGGMPVFNLGYNINDRAARYGYITFQITAEYDAPPAVRATRGPNTDVCVEAERTDFPDGSVALYYRISPQQNETTYQQLWYYGAAGIKMNIGMFANPAPVPPANDPNAIEWVADTSKAAMDEVPLTVAQVFELADAIAHS